MPESSYPNFAGKHAGEALFTAADFLAYLRQVGARDHAPAPGSVVLCYQRSLYDHVLRAEGLEPSRRGLPVPLPSTDGRVGLLGEFGIGAPAAAAALEELAALGTTAVVSVGTAPGHQFRAGISWTIDAPYRETIDEVLHYQAEGVLCVEMEAAALFAVADLRGLRLASAFVISDSLADLVWTTRFRSREVASGLVELYEAAVAALLAAPEG